MKDYTKGSIVQALFSLAGPIVLTNLLHTTHQLVNTFWVGRLGAEAVAAVSLSFPIIFLMISLGGGFSIAGTILVAQYKGAGDEKNVNHVTSQTIIMMAMVAIFVSIIGYFVAEPLMKLMGAAPNVLPDAAAYLEITFIGMIFLFSFFVFQSLMRGIGEVKTPLYIVFWAVVINLLLDPLFIQGWGPIPEFGVKGAAIATVISQGIGTLIGFAILMRGKRGIKLTFKNFKWDKALIKKMFYLGLPSSIEQSTKALGLTVMSFLVATFGTTILAAYGIGIRILTFVIIPAFGLSMATSTLVGQNMGAGKPERAEQIGKKSALTSFTLLALLGAIIFIFAKPITQTFIANDPEVVENATLFVRFLTTCFGFLGLYLTFNGVFMGSGNTKTSMIFSLVSLWMFEFPLSYILSKHTPLQEVGLWLAFPISTFITAIISFTYFRLGRWKSKRLIETPTEKLEQAVREEAMIEEGL